MRVSNKCGCIVMCVCVWYVLVPVSVYEGGGGGRRCICVKYYSASIQQFSSLFNLLPLD